MPRIFRVLPIAATARAAILATLLGTVALAPASAPAADALTPEQRSAIEGLIESHLLANPEIIMRAVEALRAKQAKQSETRRSDAIAAVTKELLADRETPIIGPADADVTMIEFFDYNCGYCKIAVDRIFALAESDKKLRVIFVELPILHETSELAARASLAANRQGKYTAFHRGLMAAKGGISIEAIRAVGRKAGLDVPRLEKDMQDPAIAAAIVRNHRRAERLEVGGTPAFVIGQAFVPGAVPGEQLAALVKDARAGK